MSPFGLGKPDIEKMKANHDVTGLLNALSHEEDPKIRKLAAGALGIIGGKDATTALIHALKDPDYYVGLTAAQALDRLVIDDLSERNALYIYHCKEEKRAHSSQSLAARIDEAKRLADTNNETKVDGKEKSLIEEIRSKSGTLSAKILAERTNDNMGRPWEKSLIVCQFCFKFLGYTEDVKKYSKKITEDYRRRAAEQRIHILSEYIFNCPNCGKENLL